MSMKMKFGSKDIPFVYKGDKLIYPNPIKDGLLLWYDFKGMRNTDTNKEVAKDLSGNGNDGTLTNFNFTEESGYKDNTLVFDGVDDNLTIPELVLDETAMAVMHDGKIYSYEDDKVLTVGEDGEIIGGSKNLVVNQDGKSIQMRPNNSSTAIIDEAYGSHRRLKRIPMSELDFGFTTISTFTGYKFNAEVGKNYIQTIEVKPEVDSEFVFLYANKAKTLCRGNEWTTLSRHFTATEAEERFWGITGGDYSPENTSWVEYRNLSVYKSNELDAIGFTPSPKDYKSTTLSPASLTDLQLYNKTLNKTELLHNAESKGLKKLKPGVVVQDGLVLHYDFSHESNTSEYKDKAFDYSGNGNHGILQNFNFTEESGYDGNALKFDGVDDFIGGEVGSLLNLDNKNQSIEITFEITNPEHRSSSLALLKSGGVVGSINVFPGWGRVTVTDNIGTNHIYTPNRESLIGKKTHLVLTKNNGLFTAHINGELVEMKDYDTELDEPLVLESLSRGSGNLVYDGVLISSRVYNRPLTPEEIAHNYQIEKEKFNIVEGEI